MDLRFVVKCGENQRLWSWWNVISYWRQNRLRGTPRAPILPPLCRWSHPKFTRCCRPFTSACLSNLVCVD